jgi:hypothetical protein
MLKRVFVGFIVVLFSCGLLSTMARQGAPATSVPTVTPWPTFTPTGEPQRAQAENVTVLVAATSTPVPPPTAEIMVLMPTATPTEPQLVDVATTVPTLAPTLPPTFTPEPTWTQAPTFTPEPVRAETIVLDTACDPSYPDFCIDANAPRLNCEEMNAQGHVNFTVLEPDPLGYDREGDGLGCEG